MNYQKILADDQVDTYLTTLIETAEDSLRDLNRASWHYLLLSSTEGTCEAIGLEALYNCFHLLDAIVQAKTKLKENQHP